MNLYHLERIDGDRNSHVLVYHGPWKKSPPLGICAIYFHYGVIYLVLFAAFFHSLFTHSMDFVRCKRGFLQLPHLTNFSRPVAGVDGFQELLVEQPILGQIEKNPLSSNSRLVIAPQSSSYKPGSDELLRQLPKRTYAGATRSLPINQQKAGGKSNVDFWKTWL